jgi:DNA sulfur modification protein DndC
MDIRRNKQAALEKMEQNNGTYTSQYRYRILKFMLVQKEVQQKDRISH